VLLHTKDDGTTDGATYGKLYNWYAVMGTVKRTQRTAAQIAARKEAQRAGTFPQMGNGAHYCRIKQEEK
jgi:hypothetical protein